jgi:beta-lactamase regulating signal transducer with metallopeptidase domain
MKFLRRLATILAGYFAAAAVGLIVPAGFLFIGFPDKPSLSHTLAALWGIASVILTVGGMLLVPTLFVITILEVLRIRNLFAYLTLGIVVSFLLSIYAVGLRNTSDQTIVAIAVVIGAAAGFTYWRMAGCSAGRWREVKARGDETQQKVFM